VPTDFARKLSQQVCEFFSITVSLPEREDLARVIDFHARHIDPPDRDDLEPLLFIECGKESQHRPLTIKDVKTIISRVQKRIFRDSRRIHSMPDNVAESRQALTPAALQRVIGQFRSFLETELSLRDAVIFEMYFIEGSGVSSLCDRLGIKKSTAYERIRLVREKFRTFLDDVGIPEFR